MSDTLFDFPEPRASFQADPVRRVPVRAHSRVVTPKRDLTTARAERDEAMTSVAKHTPAAWLLYAWDWLQGYLATHAEFFPDDVWAAGLDEPPNARALGPLVQRAAREGLIVRTDRMRPRTRGHTTPGIVWKSLVYERSAS